jgi:hypothetical protein
MAFLAGAWQKLQLAWIVQVTSMVGQTKLLGVEILVLVRGAAALGQRLKFAVRIRVRMMLDSVGGR